MKMLQGNVLVTEVEKEATTAGGIILSDPSKLDKATQPAIHQGNQYRPSNAETECPASEHPRV